MRTPRLAARTVVACIALSVGSLACAVVAGLEDKEPYPDAAETGTGPEGGSSPGDGAAGPDSPFPGDSGPTGVVTIVAKGQGKPWGVAVDDAYVYWTNEGANTVARAPKTGGDAVVIAHDQPEPHRILVDPTNVIWHNANLTNRQTTDAGTEVFEIGRLAKTAIGQDAGADKIEDVRNANEKVRAIAIGSAPDNYLWSAWSNRIRRNRRDSDQNGKDHVRNLDVQQPVAIAADAVNVYWFLQQPLEVWRSGKAFDQPGVDAGVAAISTLTGAPEINDMTCDGTSIFMVTSGGVLLAIPTPAGGPAAQITTGHPFPRAIAADDKYVYFTRSTANDGPGEGLLMMIAKDGSTTKAVAQGLDRPRGLAVDRGLDGSVTVYWANYGDGTVRRVRVR